jgi:predicted nuclease of predicted toxin-antitoxin system
MIVWLDAQLPPAVAPWLGRTFQLEVKAVRDLGLRDAKDKEIFEAARQAKAVVATKDIDFVQLVERLGQPPQILWLTCGNTTNDRLRSILTKCLPAALALLSTGVAIVEINDQSK